MDHNIDIYYFPASPPSRAVQLLAKALGIKQNLKLVNIVTGEQLDPEYKKLNPMHTVPTMNDNGFILYDSHAIMKYLVDQYAKDDSLYPKDPKKGAVVTQRLFFEATYLFQRFTEYCQPVIFRGEHPDQEKARRFEEALGHVEGFLAGQPWIAGSNMTVADFSFLTVISTAEGINFNISKFANISNWLKKAKNAMAGFGYEEINQVGVNAFSSAFNSKPK